MNQYNPEKVLEEKMHRFILLKNMDYVEQIENNLKSLSDLWFSHTPLNPCSYSITTEYNDYVEKEVISLLDRLYSNNRLDLDGFNSLPLLLKKHILCTILSEIYRDDITYINDKHLNLIFNLIDGKPNGYVCLPNGVKVYKYYKENID